MSQNSSPYRIMEPLRPLLEGKGFKFRQSEYDYIRRKNFGFERISLNGRTPSRGQHQTGLPIYQGQIILSIRFDSVETNLLPLKLVLGKHHAKQTVSVFRPVNTFYPFTRWRDRAIKISHKKKGLDESRATNRVAKMLVADGLPWLTRYSDITKFEHDVNSPPFWKATNLVNCAEGRAYKGISAAHVCGGAAKANAVSKEYLNALKRTKSAPTIRGVEIVEQNIQKLIEQLE